MEDIVNTLQLISKTMDELIDFIVTDEFLGSEFENFLIKNEIQITKESELNDVLIDYLLTGKTSKGISALGYFEEKNPNSNKEIIHALSKSFVSVFKIEKIQKNRYETYCLTTEEKMTLIPLVKTTSLRGIGLFDYISARIIEINNETFLVEIFDCISQYKEHLANLEAIKAIVKNPKSALVRNKNKLLEIKKSITSFHSSFVECFNTDEIIVSNKKADEILNNFYLYHTGQIEVFDFEKLDENFDFKYFEIEEFKNDFVKNTASGFGSSEKEYDVSIFSDEKFGLFVIPFGGTLDKILSEKREELDCVEHFLVDNKVPPSFLMKKQEKFGTLFDLINKGNKNFNSLEEALNFYKESYMDEFNFSPLNVLYNSNVFSKFLGHKEKETKPVVGRNDLCPCGSGKKYKRCCLNK